MSLQDFCRGIPKVELHCHLYGTICKETLTELNERAGRPFTLRQVDGFYIRGDKPVGVLSIFRGLESQLITSARDLYRITCEYLERCKLHNVVYSEFFWNPTGTVLDAKIPFQDAQDAILKAVDEIEKSCGVVGRLVCAIDREASPEKAEMMLDWMLQYPAAKTIGIGIDYRETGHPPHLFAETFKKAKQNGYKLTAHAGEFGEPWNNVDFVLNDLQVDRIDHGYTVIDNPALVQQCLDENVIFTVVPTNSYYLRTLDPAEWAQKHPIRKMVQLGLKVHPNTDDPAFHLVNPTTAWTMMVECFGCTIDDLGRFCQNGIEGAWVDSETKQKWRRDWLKYFGPADNPF
ncbi:LAMI_0B05974g1_1 [Lachancea mirantina]|uniref:LAMI_0B05974g1_1 n=1 Tax=Lachancea mirantina TaxID=1230905 RepID=A0A1G4IWD0_9SACH|nr:LAMI_0B05974g1_1 [Lachancea mirantina]